jgi:lipoprotein-releasing system ATP-binding protein
MNEGVKSELVMDATGVERAFRQGPIDLQVLQGVNLSVRAGEAGDHQGVGLGKTTLLQILGGLDRPTAGT